MLTLMLAFLTTALTSLSRGGELSLEEVEEGCILVNLTDRSSLGRCIGP